jgi:hypothetical protein
MKPQTSVNLWWRNAMGFARTAGDLKSRKGCRVRYGSPKDVLTNGGTEKLPICPHNENRVVWGTRLLAPFIRALTEMLHHVLK